MGKNAAQQFLGPFLWQKFRKKRAKHSSGEGIVLFKYDICDDCHASAILIYFELNFGKKKVKKNIKKKRYKVDQNGNVEVSRNLMELGIKSNQLWRCELISLFYFVQDWGYSDIPGCQLVGSWLDASGCFWVCSLVTLPSNLLSLGNSKAVGFLLGEARQGDPGMESGYMKIKNPENALNYKGIGKKKEAPVIEQFDSDDEDARKMWLML